jgi:hypothetical protein
MRLQIYKLNIRYILESSHLEDRRKWKDNTKKYLIEVVMMEGAQDHVEWWSLVLVALDHESLPEAR